MGFLTVSGISKKLQGIDVVSAIGFEQARFQKIAIAGETGSGKSTLLKMIAGLEQPDKGSVFFEGERVVGPDYQLIPGHPGIAYLSQQYELRNNYRVEELLEYANTLPQQQADALFEICRIHHLVKRKPDQLSGGEKQRIALARLLVGAPKLLLLDEPFSNLDPIHKTLLKNVLVDIGNKLQITCLLTSHDPLDTLSWADEILVMKGGAIIQQGSPETIYHQPVNEYAGGLFGSYNLLPENIAPANISTSKDKRLFIRPERILIGKKNQYLLPGSIQQIHFRGSYYEIVLMVNNTSVLATTVQTDFKTGDTVSVELLSGKEWYL